MFVLCICGYIFCIFVIISLYFCSCYDHVYYIFSCFDRVFNVFCATFQATGELYVQYDELIQLSSAMQQ